MNAFAGDYGPFRNQVAVFAHVPDAVRHLMGLLMALRSAATLPKRYLEIAIVVVSRLNECHYCVAHHKPFLAVEGISPQGIDRLLEPDNPELDDIDRLVIEYAQAAWETPNRIPDSLFEQLARPFLRSANCRTDPAHHAVRLLQPVQRRPADRAGGRGSAQTGQPRRITLTRQPLSLTLPTTKATGCTRG